MAIEFCKFCQTSPDNGDVACSSKEQASDCPWNGDSRQTCDPGYEQCREHAQTVKRLIAEKNSLLQRLGDLEGAIDEALQRLNESGTGEMGLTDTIHATHKILREARGD